MNSCKYCGKEIPEGRKFCNSSCAAKYNNTHRTRKPWTEEQRLRITKPLGKSTLHCKYCGKELEEGERRTCRECRQYTKYHTIPEKLGIVEGTPKEQYEKAIELLGDLYKSGESTVTLEQRFGISKYTIWLNLKKAGLVRSKSEAEQVAIETGRSKCLGSNPKYKHGWHTSWEGIKGYCRSSYEFDYANYLDNLKIPYRIEDRKVIVRYWDSKLETYRLARPDFYLPDTNEIVEIKSRYTYDEQNMKDKFKAYRNRGFNPRLILEGEEIEI